VLSNKNLGIAVAAIAVVAGLMLGVAGPGRAQDKAGDKPAAPAKNWKDNNEYTEADAALKEADPAKKLADLDKWKADYPATEYVDERQAMYLVTYQALKQARQAFDEAQEILKTHPNDFLSLIATVSQVMAIKPAPTPADLDAADKVASLLLNSQDTVFAPANKPAAMTDAQWTQARDQTKPYAEGVLIQIYGARRDDKRAVDDLRKLVQKDPNLVAASYQLGRAMMNVLKAANKPEDQPPALYQIARALAYDGPGALPANQKAPIQTYLTQAYTQYHGSAEGLPELLAMAKANPFPPANFTIKSTVDIAKDQEAAREEEIKKDPIMYLWVHDVKEQLATKGESYWDNVKDTGLPPADDKTTPPTPQFFKAKIISMMPATRPKELTVGIEKADVADAKLTFEMPLPGKMDAGEEIQFTGAAKDWSHDPKNVVITFDVDPKEGLKGWTGKNTPTKTGTKTGTKAAPKQ
jgi:tetratricopeptide (TPR) repeat protein